jgi:predicted nucleotidyltransferase
MSENEGRVEHLTPESIDRLHVLNELRTRFLQHVAELEKFGAFAVVGFGSSIRGTASADSDLDIGVLVDKSLYPSMEVYAQKGPELEDFLLKVCEGSGMQPEIGYNKKSAIKKDVIHVVVGRVDKPKDRPDYAKDHILLWEKPTFLSKLTKLFRGLRT